MSALSAGAAAPLAAERREGAFPTIANEEDTVRIGSLADQTSRRRTLPTGLIGSESTISTMCGIL